MAAAGDTTVSAAALATDTSGKETADGALPSGQPALTEEEALKWLEENPPPEVRSNAARIAAGVAAETPAAPVQAPVTPAAGETAATVVTDAMVFGSPKPPVPNTWEDLVLQDMEGVEEPLSAQPAGGSAPSSPTAAQKGPPAGAKQPATGQPNAATGKLQNDLRKAQERATAGVAAMPANAQRAALSILGMQLPNSRLVLEAMGEGPLRKALSAAFKANLCAKQLGQQQLPYRPTGSADLQLSVLQRLATSGPLKVPNIAAFEAALTAKTPLIPKKVIAEGGRQPPAQAAGPGSLADRGRSRSRERGRSRSRSPRPVSPRQKLRRDYEQRLYREQLSTDRWKALCERRQQELEVSEAQVQAAERRLAALQAQYEGEYQRRKGVCELYDAVQRGYQAALHLQQAAVTDAIGWQLHSADLRRHLAHLLGHVTYLRTELEQRGGRDLYPVCLAADSTVPQPPQQHLSDQLRPLHELQEAHLREQYQQLQRMLRDNAALGEAHLRQQCGLVQNELVQQLRAWLLPATDSVLTMQQYEGLTVLFGERLGRLLPVPNGSGGSPSQASSEAARQQFAAQLHPGASGGSPPAASAASGSGHTGSAAAAPAVAAVIDTAASPASTAPAAAPRGGKA